MLYITSVILQAVPKIVDHDERREQIAEAAWRVIEREGAAGANLRRIAREAGYTTGVVTHYFRDKRELMAFAFGLVADRSTSRMAGAAAEAGAAGALAQLLPLDEQRRRETTVWLALMGASLADPDLAVELRQRYRRAREATLPMFRAALRETRAQDTDEVADELLATVDGITVDALTDPERFPPERQLALLRRALVKLGLPVGPPAASKTKEKRTPLPRVGSGPFAP
jgi:TetR/AcrR family transcriptional regulator, transcriptional repressor of bet genes